MSGSRRHFNAKDTAATVPFKVRLMLPGTCLLEPPKSKIILSPVL
jgi:hypothetical protein